MASFLRLERAGLWLAPPFPAVAGGLLQCVDDERAAVLRHALERLAEGRAIVVGRHAAPAGDHGDVLLAVGAVADDAAVMPDAVGMRPQLLAALRIVGVEDTLGIRHEDEIAGGREHAGQGRYAILDFPFLLAGHGVARVEMTPGLVAAGRCAKREVGADVELRLRLEDRPGLHPLHVLAPLVGDVVIAPGARALAAPGPANPAADA